MDIDTSVFSRYRVLPMLPVRNVVVFPGMTMSFETDRSASLAALDAAMESDRCIFLTAKQDAEAEAEGKEDNFSRMGTVCRVRQYMRVQDEQQPILLMVEGVERAGMSEILGRKPYFIARVETYENRPETRTAVRGEALIRQCFGLLESYAEAAGSDFSDILKNVSDSTDPGYVADYVAQNIYMRHAEKQLVLDELRPLRRIALVNRLLRREIDIIQTERSIHENTSEQMHRAQREMFLREQMKAIQAELGEMGEDSELGGEADEYKQRIEEADLSDEVREKLMKELNRLNRQPFGSAEVSVLRNYLDICLELPWNKATEEILDTAVVRKTLDADHFGLQKIKERILEYLAVRKMAPDEKGGILCLVGPPGTGKTSIAQSIAHAMNRKLCRISLGGIHDEAEIRGHRKTYVGAMPGRIMAGIQQAGSCNPVMILDEIDKLGSDYRGDPAAALLEVLDPEQNHSFRDHYLELPFDLSQVFFITTANTTDTIPAALLDRMEILELSSYTDEEKMSIARDHLLPKQRKKHGLNGRQLRVGDDALRCIITGYTRESGVRKLEQQIAAVCRKTAAGIAEGKYKSRTLHESGVAELLGPVRFKPDEKITEPQVGLVHGLAWTSVGGVMLDAEVNVMDGSGKLELTGNLGDVMKESAQAALSYIRSHTDVLGIEHDFYKTKDIHVHFPEGAVPKDGPSAGVTVTTCMVSALSGVPVRQDVAMTGEVTLRGRVLPIGGLREKTMAALRAGMTTVIIPEDNVPDLEEIDPVVREALRFIPAARVETVLENALYRKADAE